MRTLLILLLLSSVAHAQGTLVLDSSGTRAVLVHADGTTQALQFTSIVDMRTDGPQPPGPQPPPPTPSVTQQVRGIVAGIDDAQGKQALAELYRRVAAIPGKTRAQYLEAIRQGSDTLLAVLGTADKWTDARVKFGAIVDAAEAKGTVDYPALLKQIADGIAPANVEKALPPELWALIVQIILALIERLLG